MSVGRPTRRAGVPARRTMPPVPGSVHGQAEIFQVTVGHPRRGCAVSRVSAGAVGRAWRAPAGRVLTVPSRRPVTSCIPGPCQRVRRASPPRCQVTRHSGPPCRTPPSRGPYASHQPTRAAPGRPPVLSCRAAPADAHRPWTLRTPRPVKPPVPPTEPLVRKVSPQSKRTGGEQGRGSLRAAVQPGRWRFFLRGSMTGGCITAWGDAGQVLLGVPAARPPQDRAAA